MPVAASVETGRSPLSVSRMAARGLGRTAVAGGLEVMPDHSTPVAACVEAGRSPLLSRTAAWGLGRTAVVGGLEEMADRFGEVANRVSKSGFPIAIGFFDVRRRTEVLIFFDIPRFSDHHVL
jgi:hypothetical protein